MANVLAVYSVANSILNLLEDNYPQAMRDRSACEFELFSSKQINNPPDSTARLTLYVYRLTMNEHRQNGRERDRRDEPMALTIHFMITVWADKAQAEQEIMTWAAYHLYRNSMLTASSFSPDAEWRPDEQVQIAPAVVSTEDMMRVWDALDTPYHLTMPYTARVVFVEDDPIPEGPAVVSRQFQHGAWRRE